METVLENIRQGLNHPSHRHKRVRGCMSLFVAGVTIFAQYGPLAPLGRGLGNFRHHYDFLQIDFASHHSGGSD